MNIEAEREKYTHAFGLMYATTREKPAHPIEKSINQTKPSIYLFTCVKVVENLLVFLLSNLPDRLFRKKGK